MQIVKVKSNKTFKDKKGNERPIYYYCVQHDNGKLTPIKPMYKDGYARLEFECKKYEK